jgi:hypothetical protein
MSSDSLLTIPCLLFPEVLVTYFDQTKQEVNGKKLHFSFTERNKVSEEHSAAKLHSKGFIPKASFHKLQSTISPYEERMSFRILYGADGSMRT